MFNVCVVGKERKQFSSLLSSFMAHYSGRENGIKSNSLQLDMQGNQSVYDTAGLCRKANIKREIYSSFRIIGMACDGVYTIQWPQKVFECLCCS